mmetsp:Transcript_5586/g.5102  ORF Transcript_5586/g.5102 Transcript_5586/m.5102 type:complete len:102 (+) Transcript_5586:459-764(+)
MVRGGETTVVPLVAIKIFSQHFIMVMRTRPCESGNFFLQNLIFRQKEFRLSSSLDAHTVSDSATFFFFLQLLEGFQGDTLHSFSSLELLKPVHFGLSSEGK